MKTYTLKKHYPSLPENWEVGMEVGQGDRTDGTYSPCNAKYETGRIILLSQCEVENNPEYWAVVVVETYPISYDELKDGFIYATEYPKQGIYIFKHNSNLWVRLDYGEVITSNGDFEPSNGFHKFRFASPSECALLYPKEYEILSTISTKNNKIFGEGSIHNIVTPKTYTHRNNLNENASWDIHSVKRLSDGEVFTVGDTLDFKGYETDTSILTKITIRPHTPFDLRLWASYTKSYAEAYSIERLSHIKKPLFKTVDGVDIFEGDEYYRNSGWRHVYLAIGGVGTRFCLNDKPFSTKEAAEEYIYFNEKSLSLNDLIEAWGIAPDEVKSAPLFLKFLNYVKNKRNGF